MLLRRNLKLTHLFASLPARNEASSCEYKVLYFSVIYSATIMPLYCSFPSMPIAVLIQSFAFEFSTRNNTISKKLQFALGSLQHTCRPIGPPVARHRSVRRSRINRPTAPDYCFATRGRKALPLNSTPRRGRARDDSISYKN